MPSVEYGVELGAWRIAARLFWHYTLIAYLVLNNGHTMQAQGHQLMTTLDRITQAIDYMKREMDAIPDEPGDANDAWMVLANQLLTLRIVKEKMKGK